MPHNIRIIPRLDIKGPNLVKGIHLEGIRVLGKPEDFARNYYKAGAAELIYMDVVASLYNRNNLFHFIEKACEEIFIPYHGWGIKDYKRYRKGIKGGSGQSRHKYAGYKDAKLHKRDIKDIRFSMYCRLS